MNKIYKYFFISILLFIINLFCISQEKVVIGISSPFMKNQDVNTIFIHKQFVFELLSNYNSEKYNIEIITSEISDDEKLYLKNCKLESRKIDIDYLLYSVVYTINSNIIFKILLINPYEDNVILTKIFNEKSYLNINEILSEKTQEIINMIEEKELVKVKNKQKTKDEINKNESQNKQNEVKKELKHEIFLSNGFFKNTPLANSLFTWYIGYNFTPFKFLSVETSFYWGGGSFGKEFNFTSSTFDEFLLGGYTGLYFFIDNIVSPQFGIRLEFSYIVNRDAYFFIPIDLGLKIFITRENVLRINSTFQFTYLNFGNLIWEKSYIIGLIIGYARKL
jgi:hypothetical protein